MSEHHEDQDDSTSDEQAAHGGDQTVELFMGDTVSLIAPTLSLRDAAKQLRSAEVGLLVVGTVDSVIGVISERDIVRSVALGVDLDANTVREVDSEDLKWATEGSSIDVVAEEMMENYLRHMLIANDAGQLVGVLSMRDVVTAYLT